VTITEKVSYIKGLAEGLGLEADKKEARIINEIIGVLEQIANGLTDLEDEIDGIDEELDVINAELDDVLSDDDEDEDDEKEDDAEEDGDEEDEEEFFEIECPACKETVYIDAGVLEEGKIACPGCGKELVFEIEDCECEDGCCCGCEHDHNKNGEEE